MGLSSGSYIDLFLSLFLSLSQAHRLNNAEGTTAVAGVLNELCEEGIYGQPFARRFTACAQEKLLDWDKKKKTKNDKLS